jgi:two-component system CheB/CheR fusion protein
MSEAAPVKFIAGVGASAGGLESLERFFRNVPVDSGVAFIVVQHLSADHKSLMVELIARFTRIPVSDAQDGEEIRPNHIYLLSPGKELEVNGTQLAVFQRNPERALAFPIDRLLLSLADFHGPRSIAVILSGSGSDGSRGVRRVDAMGGLVLVEDPALAAFDGMPSAAIETGAAMAVLSAEALAQSLVDHVSVGPMPGGEDVAALEDIIRLLKRRLGVDFDEYKRGTIFRRVLRRSHLRDVQTLSAYEELIEHDAAELKALHYDLLIGVTSFFRDPEAFDLLAREIDECVKSPVEPLRELRAWAAGCATGEEAYSIAILFEEAIRRAASARTFKVFATDVHPAALETAGSGIFSRDRLEHVGEERLREYFLARADGHFQISPAIRHKVVFARHDLLTDTPFTNLDVVSCRNMLIYLKPQAQQRALASLCYGLRVGGVLFLGSSETPAEMSPHFDVLSEKGKLFRKRVHSRGMHRPEIPTRVARRGGTHSEPVRPETRLLPVYDALLDRFMPPSFLVSEQRTLLDSYGGAEKLLAVARRRPSGDFLELVPQDARLAVAGVLARAQREAGPASYSGIGWTTSEGDKRNFRVQAERLLLRNAEPAYVLTLIEQKVEHSAESSSAVPGDIERVSHLEEELANARVSLQATVEELEASNEELQATNEELVASNEELQSVNEELHSVNEELHTVNAEHQLKIGELTELNRDIGHLLESIDVATIYLDRDLKIRKYTPRAGAIFGLVEHDVGRYLASFNHQLYYPGLMEDVKSVRDGGPRVEKEVRSRDERWYFVRLLSYRVGGGIEGVVVTLTDASALAAAKERARQLSSIVESSGDAIIGLSVEGTITSWNAAASRIYGYADFEMIGQPIFRLVPEEEQGAERKMLAQVAGGTDHINIEATRLTKAGVPLDISTTMSPVRDAQGIVVGIAAIDRDIREQKDLERRMRESERRYEDLYHNAPDMYLSIDTRSGRIREFNETFLRVTGFTRQEAQEMYFVDLHPASAQEAALACLARFREGNVVNDLPFSVRRKGQADLDATLSATAIYAPDGSVTGARAVLRDVSERRQAELKLAQAAQMREQFLAMVSHELRTPLHAINASFQIIDSPDADEEQRERSGFVVRRQTRQMIRLVDDLLDVSRIIHGKLQIERSPLDIGDVARGALDAVAPAFHNKGVKLVTDGLDGPLPMFGDAGRLEQVFCNLLNNSLRYTSAGRQVTVSCRRNGLACEISVTDEGSGIAPDDLQNIFNMFTQSRQGLARAEGGLGLGLTIAERIVSAHGGTLVAQSEGEGRGAQFTVGLTLDPAATMVKPAKVASGRLSIVLVEDQEDARETLKVLLDLDGHEVFAAGDGEAGLSLILERRPQVGLLDIGLPQMNGYDLAKEIRQHMGSSIKLVAMSGYGQPEDVRAAEAAGFDRHLTKPLDPRRLAAALREMGLGETRSAVRPGP